MYSWPMVKFRLNGESPSTIAGRPRCMISMSVAQTAIASMRTRTSALPGSGTFFSTSFSSSGPPSTQAFMVSGIGNSFGRAASIIDVSFRGRPAAGCSVAVRSHRGIRTELPCDVLGRGHDFLARPRQHVGRDPHGRNRQTDRADDRALVAADRRANAMDAGLELLPVLGIA